MTTQMPKAPALEDSGRQTESQSMTDRQPIQGSELPGQCEALAQGNKVQKTTEEDTWASCSASMGHVDTYPHAHAKKHT